jgi:hypothetical protein
MADKASLKGDWQGLMQFILCHYKLLKDDIHTSDFENGPDYLADRINNVNAKQFIYKFHEEAINNGYFFDLSGDKKHGSNLYYYGKKNEIGNRALSHFIIGSDGEKLQLSLRLRNVKNCEEYIYNSPKSVQDLFLFSHTPCTNMKIKALNGNNCACRGKEYTLYGKTYWRCACGDTGFVFEPETEDIPHYISLVKLGIDK